MLLLEIAFVFMKIGALAFGGAYASIAVVEKQVVEISQWMSYAEFSDLIAIDEITPGPIIINAATFVGMRMAGLPGAIAATLGAITPPVIITSLLIVLYRKYKEIKIVGNILFALKCMALSMVISTFVSMTLSTVFGGKAIAINNVNILLTAMAIASFFILKKYKLNPVYVMLACGAINLAFSLLVR